MSQPAPTCLVPRCYRPTVQPWHSAPGRCERHKRMIRARRTAQSYRYRAHFEWIDINGRRYRQEIPTPAERVNQVQEMVNQGLMTASTARDLLGLPEL